MSRGTSFVLTVFQKKAAGGTEDEICQRLEDYHGSIPWDKAGYISAQIEKGEQGTPHIQAYYETIKEGNDYRKLSIKGMREILTLPDFSDIEFHIEICKSPEDAKKYCKKDEGRLRVLPDIGEMRVGRYEKLMMRCFGPYHPGATTTYGFPPSPWV